jgi:segregation and condensation protein A
MKMFEGPFDLLVYLIETAEMNIYDIEVSEITKQYFDYMGEMEELDVTVATEFMVLAATLIEIKAKMLLPRIDEDGKLIVGDDPRVSLIAKLLEYKKFKKVSQAFGAAEDENRRFFEKPQEDISQYTDQPDEYLTMDLEHFIRAFNLFLLKKQKMEEMKKDYQRIEKDRITMNQRIQYIKEVFKSSGTSLLLFSQLLAKGEKYDTAVTFVSILEMVKENNVETEQDVPFGDIRVRMLNQETIK